MRKVLRCAYRSQRDNKDLPLASCNTTSMVMVLEASGHPPSEITPLPLDVQPEDWLTEIGDSPGGYAVMWKLCPWFFGAAQVAGLPSVAVSETERRWAQVRPAEAPMMLNWIVEQAYGRELTRYVDAFSLGAIMAEIDAGRAVLVHGLLTPQGHYVAVVGYEMAEDVGGKPGDLTALVVNDPWGRWPDYTDRNGEGVTLPIVDAMRLLKPTGGAFKSANIVQQEVTT